MKRKDHTAVRGRMRAPVPVDPQECKLCEKQIPDFLEDQLPIGELDDFLRHQKKCRNCRDELQVQYLVLEGMAKLETGETFNLQKELREFVELEESRLRRRRMMGIFAWFLEFVTVSMAFVVASVLFMYVF